MTGLLECYSVLANSIIAAADRTASEPDRPAPAEPVDDAAYDAVVRALVREPGTGQIDYPRMIALRDAEIERLRSALQSRHGGEPLALLDELDAARAKIERLEGEKTVLALGQPAVEANRKLLAEIERLRAALIQVERHAHTNRVWGGMAWRYVNCPAFRIEKIAALAGGALRALEESDAEV